MISAKVCFDVVCPWRLLGLASWDQVICATDAQDVFDFEMTSFYLRPDLATGSVPVGQHLERIGFDTTTRKKFWTTQIKVGKALGLKMIAHDDHRLVSSRAGHAGVNASQAQGQGRAMACRVLHANFVEGRDVGDARIITDIAETLPLDMDHYRAAIAGGDALRQSWTDNKRGHEAGVTGVPAVDLEGIGRIPGFVMPDQLNRIIERHAAGLEAGGRIDVGHGCGGKALFPEHLHRLIQYLFGVKTSCACQNYSARDIYGLIDTVSVQSANVKRTSARIDCAPHNRQRRGLVSRPTCEQVQFRLGVRNFFDRFVAFGLTLHQPPVCLDNGKANLFQQVCLEQFFH